MKFLYALLTLPFTVISAPATAPTIAIGAIVTIETDAHDWQPGIVVNIRDDVYPGERVTRYYVTHLEGNPAYGDWVTLDEIEVI